MSQNIPVRLVHSDGGITQIMATDIALDVERKTGGIPIPFAGGKRGGFDLNLSNATIIINGIVSDDDIISTSSSATSASATIDFSVSHHSATSMAAMTSWLPSNAHADSLTKVGTTRVTNTNTEDARLLITLHDTEGTPYEIAFVSNAGAVANHQGIDTGPSPDRYYIGIYNHSGNVAGTHAEIADNLFDVINNDSVLQTKFTATKETSALTGEANTVVRITQDTVGRNGNVAHSPIMGGFFRDSVMFIPYLTTWKGGTGESGSDSGKSAGDKVMDLYGILNNSDNATILSRIQAIGPLGEKHQGSTKIGQWFGLHDNQFGDYITGIQIPFNSMIKTDGKKYIARNFFMPTGTKYKAGQKGAKQAEVATKTFDPDDRNRAGIKGTVQKATFTQLGGEPIWTFTIIFAPIDLIW